MDKTDTILWRGIILPGHEFCRLIAQDSGWHLEGTAVFFHDQRPCQLNYQIVCDTTWHTRYAKVEGWLGNTSINVLIRTDLNQCWWLNEVMVPEVNGCIDLDLNFSPSTNLIPMQRMNLPVGESAQFTAAWLKFPSFTLEPLAQHYLRLEESLYRYESAGGQFVADLKVDQSGFVIDYPAIWVADATSKGR
ncbi:MAG: hypothetical protein A2Y88_06220 [Chloroflexi bacterium RBG_13_48_10]|jgi:hypothetical protein|nr:MAG: hypothetical protein A2Y88_06220 [Chloroflexi bacterium RBG_13_48_10]